MAIQLIKHHTDLHDPAAKIHGTRPSVPGVYAVHNDIRLTSAPGAGDVKKDISEAFRRNAKLDGDRLSVDTTSYGRVALVGTVSSWAEHDEAVAAAWSAPEVTDVDDQILVAY